jgi:hypothetical protein
VTSEHLDLGVARRQVERQLHEEPVELRLGQRVGALVLDRVHGRRHQERGREGASQPVDRDLALLHRLEEGRLRLGRRPVDLVGEQHVREDGPGSELELAGLGVVDERSGDVAGHEIGRELHPRRLERHRVSEGADEERLGDPRHPLEQDVALREQGDDQTGHRAVLRDDGLADFGADSREGLLQV